MTAKEAAEKYYPLTESATLITTTYDGIITKEQDAFIDGANWKEEQLQQRVVSLEAWKEKTREVMNDTDYKELCLLMGLKLGDTFVEELQQRIKELEEREGKFAEWASGQGWGFRTDTQMWARFSHVDRDELECYECKTTAELWAEFDKRGDNDGSNRQGK